MMETPVKKQLRNKKLNNGDEDDDEPIDKSKGQLVFRFDTFSMFAGFKPGIKCYSSDAVVCVRDFRFQMRVYTVRFPKPHTVTGMGVELLCNRPLAAGGTKIACGGGSKGQGSSWQCLASIKVRVKPLPIKGNAVVIGKGSKPSVPLVYSAQFTNLFRNDSSAYKTVLRAHDCQGKATVFCVKELLEPANGVYDKQTDVLELIADITVDPTPFTV